jgi:epoxyqueuosine reductase
LGLITLGVSYFQGPLPQRPARPAGRVARYAWGEDYHEVLGRRVLEFRAALKERWSFATRDALDAQPLLERAFARRAGLGFVGKNTNVIAPRGGSWFFLAEVLVDAALPADAPAPQGCGECSRCQTACPTDALAEPFRLNARECIAYHTIENRGWIPADFRPKLGDWLFGCDDCQDVCPFNARAKETRWPEFRADRGVGAWVDLSEVLSLRDNAAFKARFGKTPLSRAKRAGLVRNAAIVAGNLREEALAPLLAERLASDPEPVVRGHAAWALGLLGEKGALDRARGTETDPAVREEIESVLAVC